jgi:hypothetical protein
MMRALAVAVFVSGCSNLAAECEEARCWIGPSTASAGGGGTAGSGGQGGGASGGGGAAPTCGDGRHEPGELCFGDAVPYATTQPEAWDLVLVDCDADGDRDAVVAHRGGASFVALRNDGAGVFTEAVPETNLAGDPIALATGQLVGDGMPDVAVVYDGAPYVDLYAGQPGCAFQLSGARSWNNMATGWTDVAVAPFDATPGGDLAAVGDDLGLLRYGQPAVLLPTFASTPTSVAAGDLDGAGVADVLYNDLAATPKLRWQIGTGSGFTGTPGTSVDLGAGPVAVALADVDGDTDLDAVTVNADDTVSVLRSSGAPSFSLLVPDVAVSNGTVNAATPVALATADLDADGDLDVVTANADDSGAESSISLLLNDGDGALSMAPGFPKLVPRQPRAVAIDDLDGDQSPDVVVASAFVDVATSHVAVLLAQP